MSRFLEPVIPLTGLTLRIQPNEPLRVMEVAKGSAAEGQDFKKEDRVLKVNGFSAETITPVQMALELRRPELHLSVQSAGGETRELILPSQASSALNH